MDEAERSPNKNLPTSNVSLSAIQLSLATSVSGLLTSFLGFSDKREKFSEEVSNLVHDKTFVAELSSKINEPLEHESEDEFVNRASDTLRKMLYEKFGIKS